MRRDEKRREEKSRKGETKETKTETEEETLTELPRKLQEQLGSAERRCERDVGREDMPEKMWREICVRHLFFTKNSSLKRSRDKNMLTNLRCESFGT